MFSFTNRTILFLTLMLLLLLGLYGIGTVQQFLDGTFLLIARVGAGGSVALLILLLCAVIQLLYGTVAKRSLKKLWYFVPYFLSFCIAVGSGLFFFLLLVL